MPPLPQHSAQPDSVFRWSASGAHPHPQCLPPIRNPTTPRHPISASCLEKRRWPTSASPRSTSSTRNGLAVVCRWPLLFAVAAGAVDAEAGVAADAAAAGLAEAAAHAGDDAAGARSDSRRGCPPGHRLADRLVTALPARWSPAGHRTGAGNQKGPLLNGPAGENLFGMKHRARQSYPRPCG